MKPRTVAWLINGDEGYGVRRTTLEFTGTLQKLGWRTPILALHEGPFTRECRDRQFRVENLGLGTAPDYRAPPAELPKRLLRAARFASRASSTIGMALSELSADVLHFRRGHFVDMAGRAARKAGVACVWQMPNEVSSRYPFGLNRHLYQFICKRHGVFPLANSQYTASTLGYKPVNPEVLYLGVDPNRFSPTPPSPVSRADIGIPEDATVVGIFGRLIPRKGQDRILRALGTLRGPEAQRVHLLLLGGSLGEPWAWELRRLAKSDGLADRVHFHGNQPDPERYYPLLNFAVNSRVDAEPFGLSVIEGMMSGRPVLVHALGGPAETVVDGRTGWHVPESSVEAFRAGLRRALNDRSSWKQMGDAARQHAVENFSIEGQVRTYMNLVHTHLENRFPSHSPDNRD